MATDDKVAGCVVWSTGASHITDGVPGGRGRQLFKGRGVEVDKMAYGQLAGIMALGTCKADGEDVEIVSAGEVTVELVRRLLHPRVVTGNTLRVHIDPADAPGGCLLAAVAADVGAGGSCRFVQGGAGFGIVCSGQGDIHCLVEMFQRADPGSIVTGGTDSVDNIQGVMYPMVARDVGEGASRRRISVAGGTI